MANFEVRRRLVCPDFDRLFPTNVPTTKYIRARMCNLPGYFITAPAPDGDYYLVYCPAFDEMCTTYQVHGPVPATAGTAKAVYQECIKWEHREFGPAASTPPEWAVVK